MAKNTEKISIIQKLKNWVQRLSLSTRLFFRVAPLTLLLLGFFVGATIFLDHQYAEKITEEKTEMLMDILMASATDSIITEDEAVLDILITQAMMRDERIRKISVSNEEGRVLFEKVSSDYQKNKKGFIKKNRELNVSGEVFGSLVAEFDFRDLPHTLFVHDLILGGIVFIVWLVTVILFKIFSRKFFEKPLLKINQRLKFVLGEIKEEVPPLTELYELSQIEILLEKTKALRARELQAEASLQNLLRQQEEVKKHATLSPREIKEGTPEINLQELMPYVPANGHLPEADEILSLIKDLLGRGVMAKESDKFVYPSKNHLYVASYIDNNNQILQVMLVDVAFAANVGAALAMIPSGMAKEAIKAKKVEGDLLGNAREVFNIAASIFNTPHSTHVKLKEMYSTIQELPAELKAYLAHLPDKSLALEFDIEEYGNGRLTVYSRDIIAASQEIHEVKPVEKIEEVAAALPESVPDAQDFASLFADLTGKEVEGLAAPAPWDFVQNKEEAFMGCFVSPDGKLKKIILCDLPLGASLSAALAMLSPALVKESIDQKALNDEMKGNLKEVFNIAASLLNKGSQFVLKLSEMYETKTDLPESVPELLSNPPVNRADHLIKVPTYGEGKLTTLIY